MDPYHEDQTPHPTNNLNSYRQAAIELIDQLRGEPFQLRVVSESMRPFLQIGDMIWVDPRTDQVLQRGDIVVRLETGSAEGPVRDWTVHRLVRISDQGWLTKGDHLRGFDPPVTREAILGRVIRIERQGLNKNLQQFPWNLAGQWLGFYHYWLGFLFVLLRRGRGRVESG